MCFHILNHRKDNKPEEKSNTSILYFGGVRTFDV